MKNVDNLYKFKNRATNDEIIENIEDGLNLDVSNFAILICAILIASIGLNMNSVAVIIGAMLISPLMGTIIGIGYGIGTYNIEYIKRSFMLFTFEIIISLIAATIYFKLTPITGATSEMLARTSPTIFDVLIAFVGGTAGMIGLSRKRSGNVLPGVAIATALMPPLCTAGYGIATLNLKIFLGAGYLFFINSFFIAISTFLVIKGLKLPKKVFLNKSREKKIKAIIIILSILVMIPSMISAGVMVVKSLNEHNLTNFLNSQITKNSYVLNKSIDRNNKEIDLVIVGESLSNNEINNLDEKLPSYGFSGYKLKITQNEEVNIASYFEKSQNKNLEVIKGISNSESSQDNSEFKKIGIGLKTLYPQINNVIIGNGINVTDDNNQEKLLLVSIESNNKTSLNKENLIKYLKETTGYNNVILNIN